MPKKKGHITSTNLRFNSQTFIDLCGTAKFRRLVFEFYYVLDAGGGYDHTELSCCAANNYEKNTKIGTRYYLTDNGTTATRPPSSDAPQPEDPLPDDGTYLLALTRGKIMDLFDLSNFSLPPAATFSLELRPDYYLGCESYRIFKDGNKTPFFLNPSPPGYLPPEWQY